MAKNVLQYLALTLGIAAVGVVLTVAGAIYAQGDPDRAGVALLGSAVMLLSPMASGTYLWLRRRKARAHERSLHLQKEEENHRSQVEAQTKDFLRRRFIERQRLIDSVELHRAALQRNIYRAKRKNDYGRIVEDTTTDVIYEFTSSVDLDESLISVLEAEELIFEQLDIREEDDKQVGFDPSSIPFDGHSFERWVTEALVGYGDLYTNVTRLQPVTFRKIRSGVIP